MRSFPRAASLFIGISTVVVAACQPAPPPPAATTAPASASSGVLDQVKARGTLRVANPQTSPPYSLRDEKNELVGFDVDFAQELIKRMGIPKVEFIQGTFETFI